MAVENYWEKRAISDLVKSEKIGLSAATQIIAIYEQALQNINKDIEALYNNYAKKGVLDIKDLEKALNTSERIAFKRRVAIAAKKLGLRTKEVFDDRYLFRLSRLDAIKKQVEIELQLARTKETQISTNAYSDIASSSYRSTQIELKAKRVISSFSALNKEAVNIILKRKWVGGNYSSRIYKNVDQLAKELPTIMGAALSTGQSYQETTKLIQDRFEVAKFKAKRLVVTETNYIHNQAHLQALIDSDIEYYQYQAVLDRKTSKVCRELNQKIYKVKDAKVGVNYPPMHPFCRSVPSVLSREIKAILQHAGDILQ